MRQHTILFLGLQCLCSATHADDIRESETWKRIRLQLDQTPAIDTHDHLWPFEQLPGYRETARGRGMNLAGLWHNSYYTWFNPLTPWQDGMQFDDWWAQAADDFDNARSTSFYRYQLSAFRDLYGVDFETMSHDQARDLDGRIFENYRDSHWLYDVVTRRANIELMFNDPYWNRYGFEQSYPWEVIVFNVTPLVYGHHASEFDKDSDSPYVFAEKHGQAVETLDDYLNVLKRLFLEARDRGAVCLKTTLAYQRTLRFENVPQARAEKAFGRRRTALSPQEVQDFQDFIMWRLCELSEQFELPFQIHTGQARIQGSNPMLLVDLIEAHPKTKFILFHGGYPWVGACAATSLARLAGFRVAAHAELLNGETGFPRVAGRHPVQPHFVGRRLQPRRRDLRRHRIHPAMPCRRAGRKGAGGRPA